jgi:hypothetical protein
MSQVSLCPVSLERMAKAVERVRDRTHIRDLIGVDLVNPSWLKGLPPDLAERLQELLDNPDG